MVKAHEWNIGIRSVYDCSGTCIFSMHEDLITRVLIAIIIGCDVYDCGCHVIGPSKLHKFIELLGSEEKDMSGTLLENEAKKLNCESCIVKNHADSITHDPTNDTGLYNNSQIKRYEYLNNSPEQSTSNLVGNVHPSNKTSKIIKDDEKFLLCNSYNDKTNYQCIHVGKETYMACKETHGIIVAR